MLNNYCIDDTEWVITVFLFASALFLSLSLRLSFFCYFRIYSQLFSSSPPDFFFQIQVTAFSHSYSNIFSFYLHFTPTVSLARCVVTYAYFVRYTFYRCTKLQKGLCTLNVDKSTEKYFLLKKENGEKRINVSLDSATPHIHMQCCYHCDTQAYG